MLQHPPLVLLLPAASSWIGSSYYGHLSRSSTPPCSCVTFAPSLGTTAEDPHHQMTHSHSHPSPRTVHLLSLPSEPTHSSGGPGSPLIITRGGSAFPFPLCFIPGYNPSQTVQPSCHDVKRPSSVRLDNPPSFSLMTLAATCTDASAPGVPWLCGSPHRPGSEPLACIPPPTWDGLILLLLISRTINPVKIPYTALLTHASWLLADCACKWSGYFLYVIMILWELQIPLPLPRPSPNPFLTYFFHS